MVKDIPHKSSWPALSQLASSRSCTESIHGFLQSGTAINNSPTPRVQQVAPIQPIPFPQLDAFIAAQRVDPELRNIFPYLENDKKSELLPWGRYQRFAPDMHLHKGTLFCRE